MTREELLRSFLADDLLVERGHLKFGEADSVKWTDNRNNKLIEVLKLAIEGQLSDDGAMTTVRKINQLLNVGS